MTTTASIQTDMIGILNRHLATTSDLVSQLKQAHWNVVGENFIALHELFDKQADLMRGYTDEYAERIRALDGVPLGTVRQAAAASALAEFPEGEVDARSTAGMLEDRFADYSAMLSEAIRESEGVDPTTQDLLIEVQREVDRQAWFLRAPPALVWPSARPPAGAPHTDRSRDADHPSSRGRDDRAHGRRHLRGRAGVESPPGLRERRLHLRRS